MKKFLYIIMITAAMWGGFVMLSERAEAQIVPVVVSPTSYNGGQRASAANTQPSASPCLDAGFKDGWTPYINFSMEGCLAEVSYKVLQIVSWVLWVAGWFFNATINYSLNFSKFVNDVPLVGMGWKIFRDVANMCFIFILLYIAINTILQTKGADTKRLLVRVIIVAILLNFSLFLTNVVIDTSNVLALQFYEKMSSGAGTSDDRDAYDKGISQTFLKNLGLQSVYKAGSSNTVAATDLTAGNIIVVTLGGALLILVTAFVFFAGAIMFIVRTVVLIFLMILSPLAFVAMILPGMDGKWKQWLNTLLSQAFFAPIYLMMIYLVVAIISTGKFKTPGGSSINIATFLQGNPDAVGTLYTYVLLIALMLGSLFVAKQMGAMGGDFARNMAGKATFGLGGLMGRHSMGRWAQSYIKSDAAKLDKDGNFAQRARYNLNNALAKGTYDMRGSAIGAAAGGAVGGLGKVGGEGGFQKYSDDKKKRESDLAKTMLFQGKKTTLAEALKSKDDGKIQLALNAFTDAEYAELGNSILSEPLVVKNSSYSQISAATDPKNEKLNEAQKGAIYAMRNAELNDAISGKSGARKVSDVLEEMDDKEKSRLPMDILKNPVVFRHLGKGVQEKIADRTDLTPIQKKELETARLDSLVTTASKATLTTDDDDLIKGIMKGMSAKALVKLHNDEHKAGRAFLQNPNVAKYVTGAQLKDMVDLGTVEKSTRRDIGDTIYGLATTGGGAVGGQYMMKSTNRDQWR